MTSNKAILGVIPARGGSKGIPRKNLVKLNGKPLIQYTLEASLASRKLDRVVLSTDDEEIAALGKRLGIEVPFRRPARLARDKTPCLSVIRHAVEWLREKESYVPHAVMTLQPTSPVRKACHIDGAIRSFCRRKVDSLIGVAEVFQHPYDVVTFSDARMRHLISSADRVTLRQRYPTCYYINGAIYITRTPILFGSHRYGREVRPYIMDPIASFEIDKPLDLKLGEGLLRAYGPVDNSGQRGEC